MSIATPAKLLLGILPLLLIAGQAPAEVVIPLTIDTNRSSLQLTLSVQGTTDSDTQPMTGSILLAMDCFAPSTAAALRDFQIRATRSFNFHLDYGIFGEMFGSTTNLQILYANPGTNRPYESISSGLVTFRDVPNTLGGTAGYRASGIPCFALQNAGRPCVDTILLAEQQTTPIGEFPATLTLSNGILHFAGSFNFGPVTVTSGATISGVATISAVGVFEPCLRIELGPFLDDHQVGWSTEFGSYRLVRATSLTPPVRWVEAVPTFGLQVGTITNALFENPPGTASFYRLER